MHDSPHPSAGETVILNLRAAHPQGLVHDGDEFHLEDWWDRVSGDSWMFAQGNPAALIYGVRGGLGGLPIDDEVVYGKVGGLGHLIHVSELAKEQ